MSAASTTVPSGTFNQQRTAPSSTGGPLVDAAVAVADKLLEKAPNVVSAFVDRLTERAINGKKLSARDIENAATETFTVEEGGVEAQIAARGVANQQGVKTKDRGRVVTAGLVMAGAAVKALGIGAVTGAGKAAVTSLGQSGLDLKAMAVEAGRGAVEGVTAAVPVAVTQAMATMNESLSSGGMSTADAGVGR